MAYETYGERVKAYRELRGLTQPQLAEQTGIPPTSLSRIETNGRKVTLEEAVRLADVLNISLGQLAGVEEPSPGFSADVLHRVDHCRKASRAALEHVQAVIDDLDVLVGAP